MATVSREGYAFTCLVGALCVGIAIGCACYAATWAAFGFALVGGVWLGHAQQIDRLATARRRVAALCVAVLGRDARAKEKLQQIIAQLEREEVVE